MKTFTELPETDAARISGGMPSQTTSLIYDLFYTAVFMGVEIWQGATAFRAGAAEGGYIYTKVGYR